MKKLILIFFASAGTLMLRAQNINPENDRAGQNTVVKQSSKHLAESGLCFDINALGGGISQEITPTATAGYLNEININRSISDVDFKKGFSYGFDAQVAYFIGKKHHFGLGSGVLYMWQQGTLSMDNYHVEYESTDKFGSVYRQAITNSNTIEEKITTTNLNIPVVLKYKTDLAKGVGFTIDAGILYNLQFDNKSTTNAAFDYEAIYKYTEHGVAVYDNAPTPGSSDLLITKSQYLANHPAGQIQDYFNNLRTTGYNVGLGVKPTSNNSGTVSYTKGNIGFLLKPAVSFRLSDRIALNVGGYYLYQDVKHTAPAGYQLANGTMGSYNSMVSSVSYVANNVYGGTLGIRYFITKGKDSDGDGIPDGKDNCPSEPGLKQFHGCPDSDGDGIPDNADDCPSVAGAPQFHGCPDSDGDGIADNVDECPNQKGYAEFDGCPDTDGDGVPDNEDKCPSAKGTVGNHGCPEVEQSREKITEISRDMSTPILFDNGMITIKEESKPVIKQAVKELSQKKKSYIEVNGYTDNKGSDAFNKALSRKRANAVKQELQKEGANASAIKTVGHGKNAGFGDNKTENGRAANRRVIMKLKEGKAGGKAKKHTTATKKVAKPAAAVKPAKQEAKPAEKNPVSDKPSNKK